MKDIKDSYAEGYADCQHDIADMILTEYMGRFQDVQVDIVLKKIRDDILENRDSV